MSTSYQDIEVKKILDDEELKFPKNVAFACAWVMGNLKGLNLKILDMRDKSSLADFYILGSATNKTQAAAMSDQITSQMKRNGLTIKGQEGSNDADWILVDLGDVIVHIFLESSRGVYNLDGLWGDSPLLEIPQGYYYSEPEEATAEVNEKDYF